MMNNVSIIGRLTHNPELKYTTSGKQVCEFTLACNRLSDGTDFITCVCWNSQAENFSKYQNKGNLVAVSGKLTVDTFNDTSGNKRYKTYVLVNNLEYLTPKGKTEKVEEENAQNNQNIVKKTAGEVLSDVMEDKNSFSDFGESIEISEDDLPF